MDASHPVSAEHELSTMQLRFTSFAVINLRRDFHPQECAHAGRTQQKTGARPGFAFQPADNQAAMPSSNCCNSPEWYISFMMSQPPMNSPLM